MSLILASRAISDAVVGSPIICEISGYLNKLLFLLWMSPILRIFILLFLLRIKRVIVKDHLISYFKV